jgi:hypothetical protein
VKPTRAPGVRPNAEIGPQTMRDGGPTTQRAVDSPGDDVAPPTIVVPGGASSRKNCHGPAPVFVRTKSSVAPRAV